MIDKDEFEKLESEIIAAEIAVSRAIKKSKRLWRIYMELDIPKDRQESSVHELRVRSAEACLEAIKRGGVAE